MKLTATEQFPVAFRKAWMVMRITSLIILIATLHLSAKTNAQKITVNSDNISIDQFFGQLENQTGYSFFVKEGIISTDHQISVHVTNEELSFVLDQVLKPYSLSFRIKNKLVYIIAASSVNSITDSLFPASLPPIDVHGRITDSVGNPVSGATVSVKGSHLSMPTNDNGEFVFNNIGSNATILVTSVGYEKAEYRLSGQTQVTIHLKIATRDLQKVDIVYSSGYQYIAKERSTGSFAFVDNELLNRRVSPDILSRMEGVVSGMLFNKNTADASNGLADISIRGTSTLFAAKQPLIILDGFPYDGDVNNINPNTVENITILKDAASASIWGVKSGNGVIVIETKKGIRNKKPVLDFNANLTVGARPDLYYSPNFIRSSDFIDIEQQLFNQGYYDADLSSQFNIVSPVIATLDSVRNGTLSQADGNAKINSFRSHDVRSDLSKYFYQRSVDQQYAVSLTGGGLNSDYFFSMGYDNNLANQVGNKNNRVNINSLYNFYPVPGLSFSAGVNYTEQHATINSPLPIVPGGSKGIDIYPYAQLVDKNGNGLPFVKDYSSQYKDTAGEGKFLDWTYNPIDELRNADNTSKTTDSRINMTLKYDILAGLNIEAKYQYEAQHYELDNDYSALTYYARNLINEYTQTAPDGTLTYPIPIGGVLQQYTTDLASQRGRLQMNYNRNWNTHHSLSFIAGSEINQTVTTSSSNTAYGYDKSTSTTEPVDLVNYFQINPAQNEVQIPSNIGFGKLTDRYISYYSNAAYTLNGKYTASLSGRIDKSNLFGVETNQKSVPLYSAGLAWEFSKENFYHVTWLPFGKLRATYGYNGNIDKDVAALTTFLELNGVGLTGETFGIISNNGNPNLRWEKDRVINFGWDFGSVNQIITGSFEYYLKRGFDIIGDSPLPPSTGVTTFRGNTANIIGHGMDLVLNANIIRSKDFKWQANFLMSYVLDKVSKYETDLSVSNYIILGAGNAGTIYPLTNRPLYAIYSYQSAGLTHNTGDPQGYLNGKQSTDYADIIANTTKDSMYFDGPARPTTFGSFRNTFSYKGISLSFNIIYKLNYYFRRTSIDYNGLYLGWEANKDYYKRWQKPGDETHTIVPSQQYPPVNDDRETFYQFSSALVDRADNIRLQDISLSYDLPTHIKTTGHGFSRVQIFAYLNNVGLLWKANHDGLDPDLFTNALPFPRSISFGVKATL